jgi:hypothetical protein
MAGYSDGLKDGIEGANQAEYHRGYVDGYGEGQRYPLESVRKAIYDEGYTAGETAGYSDGYFQGDLDGYSKGNEAGYKRGYRVGYDAGIVETMNNMDFTEWIGVAVGGFLDFTLHPKEPEFYATYKMLNVKNHLVYSDKFILSVVNLNQIELATKEDKAYNIDYWARIFKAKTWEELKMFAKDNEYLQEAAESLYVANADEIVRQQCRAREDAERLQRTLERDNTLLKKQLANANEDLANANKDLANANARIKELEAIIANNTNK